MPNQVRQTHLRIIIGRAGVLPRLKDGLDEVNGTSIVAVDVILHHLQNKWKKKGEKRKINKTGQDVQILSKAAN